jgi:hypothetical protein
MEPAPTPQVAELSLPQRIWGVLVSPRIVFEYLNERPRLLGALAFLIVLNLGVGYLMMDLIVETRLADTEDTQNLTEEELASSEKLMRGAVLIGSAIAPIFTTFVPAAILLFLTNVILGGSTNYKHLAAAFAHIGMVSIPMVLVRVPLMKIQGDADIRTSLAAFVPKEAGMGFAYQLLNQFDIFTLWMLGLSVLAVSVMGGVLMRRAAYGVVGAWVLWLLIWVPFSTFTQSMQAGQ